jgi:hypothetical protein
MAMNDRGRPCIDVLVIRGVGGTDGNGTALTFEVSVIVDGARVGRLDGGNTNSVWDGVDATDWGSEEERSELVEPRVLLEELRDRR